MLLTMLVKDIFLLWLPLQAEVSSFMTLVGLKAVEDRMGIVLELEARLTNLQELAELYQGREDIFHMAKTEYPQLDDITKSFEPYAALWRTCAEFTRVLPDWMDGPFTEIDAETVASDCDR